MTKERLETIRALQRKVYIQRAKLREHNEASLVSSPQPSASHGSGISDRVGNRGDKTIALENELAELQADLDERMAFIDGIEDAELQEIVRDKCVYNFKWRQILVFIGKRPDDEESVKKSYQRFMASLENCPETGQQNT